MEADAGRPWVLAPAVPAALREALPDLHPAALQVLFARGLDTPAAVRAFLDGDGAALHDPRLLYGMEAAVARLRRAIQEGQTVAVHGDFDVDGITATAILCEGLGAAGGRAVPYLPQRTSAGYGLLPATVERIAGSGASLIVTADTGTRAIPAAQRAAELGLDVIVTDHHLAGSELPPAVAVINPQQPACAYPFKSLSGAGVAWKLVHALSLEGLLPEAFATDLLDLVALGTIVDVSPLRGENRALVRRGLRRLAEAPRPGLRALLGSAGSAGNGSRAVDEHLVAFTIGPRLNAAGRMDDPGLALELLLTRDPERAMALVRLLEGKNTERQLLTERVLQPAREQAAQQAGRPLHVLRGDSWPGGVIGLVAGRVADETGRPVFVVDVGEETCRGSGRGPEGTDLVALLDGCAGLLLEYGGHMQAAGFAALSRNLDEITERLLDLAGRAAPVAPAAAVADLALREGDLDWALYKALQPLRPFGQGNPAPTFISSGLQVLEARVVGASGRHLRARVRFGREVLTAFGPDLGPRAAQLARRGRADALFSLDSSEWNGYESLELRLVDVRPTA
jgi:single-stranded-DNA-specific exonuclease